MTDFMRDEIGAPKVVDRSTFHAELDALLVREKAHTREGDAIAAARRRLPMVEVRPTITLIGPHLSAVFVSSSNPSTVVQPSVQNDDIGTRFVSPSSFSELISATGGSKVENFRLDRAKPWLTHLIVSRFIAPFR